MRHRFLAIAMAGVLIGCTAEHASVHVSVSGAPEETSLLQVTLSLNGERAIGPPSQVSRNRDSFIVSLPSGSHGRLELAVGAMRPDGCQIARGEAGVDVDGARTYRVDVDLLVSEQVRGCRLSLYRAGDGTGEVTVQAGKWSTLVRWPDGEADHRDLYFPGDTEVSLEAWGDEGGYPGTYFAAWTGACRGRGTCRIRIGSEPQSVGVGLLPRRSCSIDGWCWENPLPQGNALRGVWGADHDDVWTVGVRGTTLHWNGRFWSTVRSGTQATLNGVWGSGADDVWAVGDGGTILHWDGRGWDGTHSLAARGTLSSLWGSGRRDVWVLGEQGIFHWDGNAWRAVELPQEVRDKVLVQDLKDLRDVWGSGPDDVWFVGTGLLLRWSGAWSVRQVRSGDTAPRFQSLWGSGPRDLWIVSAETFGLDVYRYDGVSLTWVAGLPGHPAGVWGSGPEDVWVASDSGSVGRWNGRSFSDVRSGGGRLRDIWAGESAVWAVGDSGTLLSWNGVQWNSANGEALLREDLHALWIGGLQGSTIYAGDAGGSIVEWTGSTWQKGGMSLEGDGIHGFWGSDVRFTWAVGSGGSILRYAYGIGWLPELGPTMENLLGIWGSSPGPRAEPDVWAVGSAGTILRWQGGQPNARWTPVVSGVDVDLRGVWGSGPNDVWAVGRDGTMLRWQGASWAKVPSGTSVTLNRIWGSGAQDVWAVGDSATVRHWDGAAWSAVTVPASGTPDLLGLWGRGAADVWIVGGSGTVLHWDGTAWSRQESGVTGWLGDIIGTKTDIWAVGEAGSILRHPLR